MVVNAAGSGGVRVIGPGVAEATIGRTAWGLALAAQMVGGAAGVLVARLRVRRALLLGVLGRWPAASASAARCPPPRPSWCWRRPPGAYGTCW